MKKKQKFSQSLLWQLRRPGKSRKELIDPYVTVSIVGTPNDCQSFRTATVYNNGFQPVWNQKVTFKLTERCVVCDMCVCCSMVCDFFNIRVFGVVLLRCSETAILVIRIDDEEQHFGDILLGWYAIPVHAVRDGLRVVEPLDRFGEKIPVHNSAALFVVCRSTRFVRSCAICW